MKKKLSVVSPVYGAARCVEELCTRLIKSVEKTKHFHGVNPQQTKQQQQQQQKQQEQEPLKNIMSTIFHFSW